MMLTRTHPPDHLYLASTSPLSPLHLCISVYIIDYSFLPVTLRMHLWRRPRLRVAGRRHFTKQQLDALQQGERGIRAEEWAQRRPKRAPFALPYPDDLSVLDPVLDHAWWPMGDEHHQPIPLDPNEGQTQVAAPDGVDLRRLLTRTLISKRVVNQTPKGKIPSIYALAVCGNGAGLVGIGQGKHEEAGTASSKALRQAAKQMVVVPRHEGRTIFHAVEVHAHGVDLALRPRPPGFGVRTNHFLYEVCRCAGLADLSAKVRGSRNGMNVVKAFLHALQTQQRPDDLARARGRRLVDARRVFFS